MATAAELRDEASRLRAFALTATDPAVLIALRDMIEELEARARGLDEGALDD
jgi:hypothetical protein